MQNFRTNLFPELVLAQNYSINYHFPPGKPLSIQTLIKKINYFLNLWLRKLCLLF